MATRGPKPKPELTRYEEAGCARAIYVLEAGCYIKVGQAASAVSRLKTLHTSLKRLGLELGRFTVFPLNARELHGHESKCIRALRREAENVAGHREYFAGIDYDTALSVVREALAEV